jgi:hypothetical protein
MWMTTCLSLQPPSPLNNKTYSCHNYCDNSEQTMYARMWCQEFIYTQLLFVQCCSCFVNLCLKWTTLHSENMPNAFSSQWSHGNGSWNMALCMYTYRVLVGKPLGTWKTWDHYCSHFYADHGRWRRPQTVDVDRCILRCVKENPHSNVCWIQAAERVVCKTVYWVPHK